ncbi:hypothetical protein [Corynebacterium cystitidis]|uniref:Uncharacterized protein n=1 Tax=Corynebacterium cystitidis DSM 20524 TaxID=1121357 RepID=A0A1H9T3G8_9CORY|nr:hypothetical protein [Corynebacterium cystitidis]WJY83445.1 hypothetical protein CCYS_12800 [Corynebacterium cystitidis DSM 20524]SER91780.1 hypothetical protein SAMN05661109_01302 [Corynebacterium cystitidis DSM 20524]SNV61458.1 Uncharacterised protein [Corynebacterium cystitidis]
MVEVDRFKILQRDDIYRLVHSLRQKWEQNNEFFDEFSQVVINAANASWTRIGHKMMWYCQPGDVVFLLILERKNNEHYFELTLRYALRKRAGDDLVSTQCGAIAPFRRLVNKHDLELVAHYPGNEKKPSDYQSTKTFGPASETKYNTAIQPKPTGNTGHNTYSNRTRPHSNHGSNPQR